MMKMTSLFVSLVLLAGCVSPPPPEFAVYTAAFDRSHEAAVVTMKVWEPIEKANRLPTPDKFLPDEAAYIADEGRPGNALLIERGFASVSSYNEILTRFAGGESVSTLKPATTALSENVGALALTVGAPGVGTAVSAAIGGLETLASALLAVSDRAEFRRAVKAHTGKVDEFLAETRRFTSDMFLVARTHAGARKVALIKEKRFTDIPKVDADVATFKKLLASWVLTIDDTRKAVSALANAVEDGDAGGLTIGTVAFWTGEINRHAEAVKFAARNMTGAL